LYRLENARDRCRSSHRDPCITLIENNQFAGPKIDRSGGKATGKALNGFVGNMTIDEIGKRLPLE
jgi:hypothetical protein